MRTTIAESEYHLVASHRNPRIERDTTAGGGCVVVLDDAGYGRHRAWVTDSEADELVSLGMRDARDDEPTPFDDFDE